MKITFAETALDDILAKFTSGDPIQIRVGYLLGERTSDEIRIHDVVLPKQASDPMLSEISIIDEMSTLKEYRDRVVGLVQYNGRFPLSETTESKHTGLRMEEAGLPNLAMILNARGEYEFHDRVDPSKTGPFENYERKVLELLKREGMVH